MLLLEPILEMKMQVSHINRFRMDGHYSIESYFKRVVSQLRADRFDVIACTSLQVKD